MAPRFILITLCPKRSGYELLMNVPPVFFCFFYYNLLRSVLASFVSCFVLIMFLLAEQLLVRNVDCCVVTVSDRCMLCA